jgi:hypothetical protein
MEWVNIRARPRPDCLYCAQEALDLRPKGLKGEAFLRVHPAVEKEEEGSMIGTPRGDSMKSGGGEKKLPVLGDKNFVDTFQDGM